MSLLKIYFKNVLPKKKKIPIIKEPPLNFDCTGFLMCSVKKSWTPLGLLAAWGGPVTSKLHQFGPTATYFTFCKSAVCFFFLMRPRRLLQNSFTYEVLEVACLRIRVSERVENEHVKLHHNMHMKP